MYSGFIYEWTNKINNMKYLGSHKGTIDDGYLGSGKVFLRAIKKYGLDNFTRKIIEYVEKEENIFKRENYYLQFYNCASDPLYYNISATAHGGDTCNNEHNWKKVSDKWQVKLPNGKTIIIFNMRKFCQEHGLNPSAMSAVARGNRRHYKNYWCKKITNNRNVKYKYTKWKSKGHGAKANYGAKNGYSKKIEVNGILYQCMREAVDKTGLSMFLLRKQGKFI